MEKGKLKELSDYKDEIHKCSKCGQCQAVCPLFQTTSNECVVSRGQFIMLDGVIKNKLKLSKNIEKYIDMCLKCGKCSGFCPSEIDVVNILLSAKHECFKNSFAGKIYAFFESKAIFNTFLNLIKFFFRVIKFSPRVKSKKFDTKSVYFGGCLSVFSPDVENYIIKLLNKCRIEVADIDFNCCGMPFLTTGNQERFIEAACENIRKIPDDTEFLITDCASCEWAWSQYIKYIDDDELKRKLEKIKIKSLYEIIVNNDLKFSSKKSLKLSYHKPCHEKHADTVLKLLKQIKNCDYIELYGMEECCGFSSFEHPYILKSTKPVRDKKRDSLKNSKADIVLTSCAGCLLSLNIITIFRQRIFSVINFLKKNCK